MNLLISQDIKAVYKPINIVKNFKQTSYLLIIFIISKFIYRNIIIFI